MRRTAISVKVLAPVIATAMVATGGWARWVMAMEPGEEELHPVSAFASITDETERSAALFAEAAKVLQHPRCINCHPAGEMPLQGENFRSHEPPVQRGRTGFGVVGMRCQTCHLTANYDPGRVPGAPTWRLAPASMAWEGLSPAELCAQLKDPERTGGRDLEAVAEHLAEDELVAWGWEPGMGREPAPGNQQELGKLIRAWIKTGAACPAD